MNTFRKIQFAEQRIDELKLLIRHWKSCQDSSETVSLEIIGGVELQDSEQEAA